MSDENNYVGEGDSKGSSNFFGWSNEENEEVVNGITKGQNTVLNGHAYFNPDSPKDPNIDNIIKLPKI